MKQNSYTVAQVAEAIGASFYGDGDLQIFGVAEPQNAGARELAMATDKSYAERLSLGEAKAAVLWADADWRTYGLSAAIVPSRPRYAMSGVTKLLDQGQGFEPGIHPSAIIDPSATIGENVQIGAMTIVSADARIAEGSVLESQIQADLLS